MGKHTRNLLVGALLSAFFLWLALRGLDWPAVGGILGDLRWQYAPLIVLIWVVALTARAWRWVALLGGRVPLRTSFHILNIGILINNTIPFRVGDLSRAYLMGRDPGTSVSGWEVLSTVIAERVVDMLAMVLLLALVLLALPVDATIVTGGVLLGVVSLIGFGVLVALASHPAWVTRLIRAALIRLPWAARFQPEARAIKLIAGLRPLTTWRSLLRVAAWTGLIWLLAVLEPWTLALLFPGLPAAGPTYAALTLAVITVAFSIIVPFTFANVGPFEAAVVVALVANGFPQEVALTFAILWHVGLVLNSAVWGTIGFLALQLSPREMRAGIVSLHAMPSETGPED